MSSYIDIQVDDDARLATDNTRLLMATTLLSRLKQEDYSSVEGFTDSHSKDRGLRLLSALAFILPRSSDVVAVMAKLVPGEVRVLVANEQSEEVDDTQRRDGHRPVDSYTYMLPDFDDNAEPNDKLSFLIANNSRPADNDRYPRRLFLEHIAKQNDDFDVWKDLCHHLEKKTATFLHHSTIVAHLLNITLQHKGIPDSLKLKKLLRYCAVRQTQKLQQRLRRHPLALLRAIMAGASVSDFTPMSGSFPAFEDIDKELMSLTSLSPDTPDAQSTMFLKVWNFISEVLVTMESDLGTLENMKGPELLQSKQHQRALIRLVLNLEAVRHISWDSDFFTSFLNQYLPQILIRRAKNMNIPGGEALFTGHPPVYEDKDEAYEHDAVAQAAENSLPDDNGRIGPIQKALRFVSSLLYHTWKIVLNKRLAGQQVDFDVLTYSHPQQPEVGNWKETIIRLLPEASSNIINKVESVFNSKGSASIALTASVHCEALLGALRWRLRNMPSNANLPAQSFFQQSYPLLAVSKRCCPACAIILSHLNKYGGLPKLGLYAKHPVIFPCAFPPYLPKPTRDAVIKHFEDLLVDAIEMHTPSEKPYETQLDPSESSSEDDSKRRKEMMRGAMLSESEWE